MHLTMQTVIANLFAATATVVVFAFPSPTALKNAIFGPVETSPPDLQVIDFRQTGYPETAEVLPFQITQASAEQQQEASYIALLNDCAFYLGRTTNPDTAMCADSIRAIRQEMPERQLVIGAPQLDPLSEALYLSQRRTLSDSVGARRVDLDRDRPSLPRLNSRKLLSSKFPPAISLGVRKMGIS